MSLLLKYRELVLALILAVAVAAIGFYQPVFVEWDNLSDMFAETSVLFMMALAQMVVALAREQALAHQELRPAQRAALDEVLVLRHQHLLDQIRVVEHEDRLGADAEAHHVAVIAPEPHEEGQRVAAEAHEQGAKFWACPANLELFDKSEADLIPECSGMMGAAAMIQDVMDGETRVLTF